MGTAAVLAGRIGATMTIAFISGLAVGLIVGIVVGAVGLCTVYCFISGDIDETTF